MADSPKLGFFHCTSDSMQCNAENVMIAYQEYSMKHYLVTDIFTEAYINKKTKHRYYVSLLEIMGYI